MRKSRGKGGRRHADKKKDTNNDDGFGEWGGYMAAKRAKLLKQFHDGSTEKLSDIFKGVEILVNGLTHPSANELQDLMAAHGGVYHMYQVSSTTHIIASNLPNVKIKHLGSVPIVKPTWITESIALGKLLDYRRYLLYTNQSTTQPALNFPVIPKTDESSKQLASPEHLAATNLVSDTLDMSSSIKESNENFNKCAQTLQSKIILPQNTNISNENEIEGAVKNKQESSMMGHSRIIKTASDPKFLEEFYNNSRLHLISTLGAEFKLLVSQMREKSNGNFPGKEKLIAGKGRYTDGILSSTVVMHIDMDCFFVSVGLRNHPELKGKPVAITHARSGTINVSDPNRKASREKEFELYCERLPEGMPSRVVDIKDKMDSLGSMSEIASCSYEARKFGIKNGMFLGTAINLCPELRTLPYDFEGYKEVSHTLYNIIASYTLNIEAVSCDEMYVDVTKILIETGLTVEEWATHIRNEIMTATGCPCSTEFFGLLGRRRFKLLALDVSPTRIVIAHLQEKQFLKMPSTRVGGTSNNSVELDDGSESLTQLTSFGANRLQARLATRKAKPAGQYHLKADDVETYMTEIPLADLPGVGRATLVKLKNLGLTTCGDVQLASLKLLQLEIGQKAGETVREQSFGRDSKPLNFNHERKSVSAEVNYGIRFKNRDEAYSFLESLSNEVFNRINDIGMRARSLTLKLLVRSPEAPVETAKFLGHGVCDALSKSTTSNSIINDPKTIFREARTLYDKINPTFSDLRGVGIQLTKLEKNISVNNALSNFLKQGFSSVKKSAGVLENKPVNEQERQETTVKHTDVSNVKSSDPSNVKHSEAVVVTNNDSLNVTHNQTEKNVKKVGATTTEKDVKKVNTSPVGQTTHRNEVKSKRGRSKGVGNKVATAGTSKSSRNTLNSFLGKSNGRGDNVEFKNNKLLPNMEVDFDVLRELPEEIRNEIMKEYNLSPLKVVQHNAGPNSQNKSSKRVTQNKRSDSKDTSDANTQKKKSLFQGLSWEQIKPIIKSWIDSEPEPNEVDVEMLAEHFKSMAIERQIEVLKCVFNFLFRTFSSLNCAWHKAYFSLVNGMQQGMVARYGNTLLVDRKFHCCQI